MSDALDVIADLVARGHAVRFQARGDSMYPAIRNDDFLQIEPVADASVIRRGEVVMMRADRGLTVHRVIANDGATILARGDNASDFDAPLPYAKVIGRVVSIERDGKARAVSTSVLRATLTRIARRLRARFAR